VTVTLFAASIVRLAAAPVPAPPIVALLPAVVTSALSALVGAWVVFQLAPSVQSVLVVPVKVVSAALAGEIGAAAHAAATAAVLARSAARRASFRMLEAPQMMILFAAIRRLLR
jgi:hypothetical protein